MAYMNRRLRKLLLLISFCYWETNPALADQYPKNLSIDILHYKFELLLSDDTNEIGPQRTSC